MGIRINPSTITGRIRVEVWQNSKSVFLLCRLSISKELWFCFKQAEFCVPQIRVTSGFKQDNVKKHQVIMVYGRRNCNLWCFLLNICFFNEPRPTEVIYKTCFSKKSSWYRLYISRNNDFKKINSAEYFVFQIRQGKELAQTGRLFRSDLWKVPWRIQTNSKEFRFFIIPVK